MVVYAFLDLADGGAERLTIETSRHLDTDRYRPHLLCVHGAGPIAPAAAAAGIAMSVMHELRRPWAWSAVPRIASRLVELEAQIVHVPLFSRASPYVRAAARLARVPLVVAHDWSRPDRPRLARRVADRLLRRGTRFVAASRAQQRELLAGGVAAHDVAVVHAGIDCERFAGGDRGAARAALGLDPRSFAALVPARLHSAKGHEDLLEAVPRLARAVPGLVVLLAGDGPRRAELESRVHAGGISGAVRFLGRREDMPDLYAAADLVVLPSRVEGLPSAMLEAFAAGRAVVASDVGGVAEALTDGLEGRCVPPRSPSALAEAVAVLARDPATRVAMGARGLRCARERFEIRSATRRLEAVYGTWLADAGIARVA